MSEMLCFPKPTMVPSHVLFTTQIYSVFCNTGKQKQENIHILEAEIRYLLIAF